MVVWVRSTPERPSALDPDAVQMPSALSVVSSRAELWDMILI